MSERGELDVVKAQHRTPEYVAAYRAIREAQARGELLWCSEPRCKVGDRTIYPSQRASVSHDPTGLIILGPGHLTCNLSEAATRGNKMRTRSRSQWVL